MHLFDKSDRNGVHISVFDCDECREVFSVSPAPLDKDKWNYCLSKKCESYDESRVGSEYFIEKPEIFNCWMNQITQEEEKYHRKE